MNNIGLLARIWGTVTLSGRGWFYLDDGSFVQDGSGIFGIYVESPGPAVPPKGAFVFVTGISSCEYYQGNLVNVLLARAQSDIVILSAQPQSAKTVGVAEVEEDRNPRAGGNPSIRLR